MRITSNTYSNTLLDQLNLLANRQSQLQTQAASGQRVRSPEDDPSAMRRVLGLQAEAGTVAQFQKNVVTEQGKATTVFSVLQSLKKISDRVGEIATLADGLRTPDELKIYASEVSQLTEQAFQLSNTKFNGSFLFSGTRGDQAAFSLTRDVDGNITAVAYEGNEGVAEVEISDGSFLTSTIPGATGSASSQRGLLADTASGADFFKGLISLREHLASGDVEAIATVDRPQLLADENNLLQHMSESGAIQARLQAATSQLKDRATALTTQISAQADADLAETMVNLNATQTAYQAALQSSAKILNSSLMDYLR